MMLKLSDVLADLNNSMNVPWQHSTFDNFVIAMYSYEYNLKDGLHGLSDGNRKIAILRRLQNSTRETSIPPITLPLRRRALISRSRNSNNSEQQNEQQQFRQNSGSGQGGSGPSGNSEGDFDFDFRVERERQESIRAIRNDRNFFLPDGFG